MTPVPSTWPDLSAHGLSLWLVETSHDTLVALSGEPVGIDAVAMATTGLSAVDGRPDLRVSRLPEGNPTGHDGLPQAFHAFATAFPDARTVPFSHALHHLGASGSTPTGSLRFPDVSTFRPGAVSTWRSAVGAEPAWHVPRRFRKGWSTILNGHVAVDGRLHEVLVQGTHCDTRVVLGNALPRGTRGGDLWPSRTLVAVEAARAASADMALAAFASGLTLAGKGVDDPWGKAAGMAVRRSARVSEGRSERMRLDCGGADAVLWRDLDGHHLELDGGMAGSIRVGPIKDPGKALRAANALASNQDPTQAGIAAQAMVDKARESVAQEARNLR